MDRVVGCGELFFFFSSRRRHTRCSRDWSSDVCSSDLAQWYYGDWVAIVDPFFWVVPLVGLAWGARRHWAPALVYLVTLLGVTTLGLWRGHALVGWGVGLGLGGGGAAGGWGWTRHGLGGGGRGGGGGLW